MAAHTEKHTNGKVKATWAGGQAQDGRYVLHGRENWFFEDGRKQYEATYQSGRKFGAETLWRPDRSVLWQWEHRPDGTSVWTQFWEDGTKKSVSTWRDHKANGPAQCWDRSGKLISETTFSDGQRR
jgi:antitoxin component YwqK of YwqJK toxin-antitoxin module